MSGFRKISTAIVAVFIGCFLAFTCLVYFHIQNNIEEEMTGALNQVREMVSLNISVADIEAIVEPSPHLSAHYFTGRLQADYASAYSKSGGTALTPVIIPIQENQYLIVTPFDATELTQNLTFFCLGGGTVFRNIRLAVVYVKSGG